MNCSPNAQLTFNIRLSYIIFLILSSIYCIVSFSLYHTLLPLAILIANAMSLFNSLIHVCDIIYYNRHFPLEDGFLLCMFDLMPNCLIIYSIVCYIIYLSMDLIPTIQMEFALMIIYAIVGACVPLIYTIIWYFAYYEVI